VRAYREAMASFGRMGTMDVWYASLDEDELKTSIRNVVAGTARQEQTAKKAEQADKRAKAPKKEEKRAAKQEKVAKHQEKAAKTEQKRAAQTLDKAHTRDSLQALSKLGELVDGQYRIVSQPPIVVPLRDLAATYGLSAEETEHAIREQFRAYRQTLQDDRRLLLERFEIVDAARKVVGVGSVGTQTFIVLLQGRDAQDPLFLQIKEATASVLEPYVRKSRYRQHGERVVQG
jgi:flagellar biosynthesis GTPase FlhF